MNANCDSAANFNSCELRQKSVKITINFSIRMNPLCRGSACSRNGNPVARFLFGKKRMPFMQSFLPVSLDLLPFQDRSKDYPFICRLSVRERAIGRFKFYCQRFCFSLLLPDVSLLKVGTEGISCQSLDRLNRCGGEICCGKYSAASFQIAPVKRAVAVSAAESIRCIDVVNSRKFHHAAQNATLRLA